MKAKTIGFSLFLLSMVFLSPTCTQANYKINSPNQFHFYSQAVSGSLRNSFGIQLIVVPESKANAFCSISAQPVSDTTKKKDRDGDGIVDSLDKCPDEKGVIEYDGCPVPDSDNDGIPDDVDDCPTIAGLAKYKGCPPPDRDGDKINDEDDKCPDQPGVARYNGCPVDDRDGDGVNDDNDKCIDTPGTIKNAGCPEDTKISKHNKKKSHLIRGKPKTDIKE